MRYEFQLGLQAKQFFSKGDTTKWSEELYTFREIFIDTLPAYHRNNLPERYKEALMKRSEPSMKDIEKNQVK